MLADPMDADTGVRVELCDAIRGGALQQGARDEVSLSIMSG